LRFKPLNSADLVAVLRCINRSLTVPTAYGAVVRLTSPYRTTRPRKTATLIKVLLCATQRWPETVSLLLSIITLHLHLMCTSPSMAILLTASCMSPHILIPECTWGCQFRAHSEPHFRTDAPPTPLHGPHLVPFDSSPCI